MRCWCRIHIYVVPYQYRYQYGTVLVRYVELCALDVGNCLIGPDGAKVVAQAIDANQNLNWISVIDNPGLYVPGFVAKDLTSTMATLYCSTCSITTTTGQFIVYQVCL